ncbi:unnamed protein product [Staurois parvus]|uniref:Uncharacterized protein n=1 Tax=Staurois parvus TaxID=386267 RepID=A0ABN9B779_9NEOB|nr:unnamed protein product [Staurois parvus]
MGSVHVKGALRWDGTVHVRGHSDGNSPCKGALRWEQSM